MIGLIQQGRFGCGRERPALDLGRDCSFAKRVERPPERMDSSASLSCSGKVMFAGQTANGFQSSRSVAASRNLNLFANVQVEFHRQSTSYCVIVTRQPRVDNPLWRVRPDSKTPKICFTQGFGLRSASGRGGAESGEKRLAKRSRSATPAAEPQTEARRNCGPAPCKLVTSARFAKRNGQGRGEEGPTVSPRSEAKRALVTAKQLHHQRKRD